MVAGTIVGMYTYQGQIAGVELNQNAPVDPQGNNVYTISSANFDYAAGTIAGLWYSWAQYYAQHMTSIAAAGRRPGDDRRRQQRPDADQPRRRAWCRGWP